jgi:DNA (cytosine-5)-methyltransferase 1
MPLTLEMTRTFYPTSGLKDMLDDLVAKNYLVFEYPKQKIAGRRVYDEACEKGYNIVTGKLSFEFNRVLDPADIAPTLVATDISRLAVPVDKGIRPLTVREGLRLFGFPEHYILSSLKQSEAFALLGNTVCVPVIRALCRRLIENEFVEWGEYVEFAGRAI